MVDYFKIHHLKNTNHCSGEKHLFIKEKDPSHSNFLPT